jgi:DNA-binding transcriptional regulator YbjK
VKDAEALIKNVGSSGLTDPQKIKELISIIGEVPESERTPTLVKAQREALRADAKNTRAESVKAAKQSELITDTMTKFNKLLQEGGVKVSLGETPMVGIEIMSSDLSATQRGLGTRASSRDVVGGDQ